MRTKRATGTMRSAIWFEGGLDNGIRAGNAEPQS